jgi:uncharacterized protein YndB with AHSA1/START domain
VYELPREIVWDALVDSDLISGWLAEADVEPRIGGRFDLDWSHLERGFRTEGEIVELIGLRTLVVDMSSFGRTTFTLDEVNGGPRGSSTLLTVDVHAIADPEFSGTVSATWRLSLEQLEHLLHGHPVNWSTWIEDVGEEWRALVSEANRAHQ